MTCYKKRFVCLARSCHGQGYRIAGKEWRAHGPGPWILPVVSGEEEVLHSWELACVTGETLDVLHIVSAKFIETPPQPRQREKHFLAGDNHWQHMGRLAWTDLPPWLDHPVTLWESGHHSCDGYNDLVPHIQETTTLHLIQVKRLDLIVTQFGCGQPAIRGRFAYRDTLYDMEVTDSWLKESLCHAEPQKYSLLDSVICLSLEKADEDHCQKVIASVLFQRRFS